MNGLSVTIVIPTLNAGPQFRGLLQALKEQTLACDLLVVDSSSQDGTRQIAESFGARTILIRQEDFDHGGTRSLAAQSIGTDIIVYLTQDTAPADQYALERLVRPFGDPTIGAAYGRQLPRPDASAFAAHMRLFKYPAEASVKGAGDRGVYGIETPFLSDSFSAYRREALVRVGLFKAGTIFAEDVYAGARLVLAGYRIAYVAEAAVYHSHNHSMVEECKRYFDTAVFYRTEAWITGAFGTNNSEAWRYIKSEFSYLRKQGGLLPLIEFFPRNALRVLGFGLGRAYRLLPRSLCRMLSSHPGWWDAKREEQRA